jgi:hypothetical protein
MLTMWRLAAFASCSVVLLSWRRRIMPDQRSTSRATSPPSPPLPADVITPPRPPRAPRYSVRSLLILTTVVAIVAVLAGAYGMFFLRLLTATVFLGSAIVCVTAAIYCRGGRQSFFVGAACVACFAALGPPAFARGWAEFYVLTAGHLIAMVVAGGIAVVTRKFVEKRGWNTPPHKRRGDIGE